MSFGQTSALIFQNCLACEKAGIGQGSTGSIRGLLPPSVLDCPAGHCPARSAAMAPGAGTSREPSPLKGDLQMEELFCRLGDGTRHHLETIKTALQAERQHKAKGLNNGRLQLSF